MSSKLSHDMILPLGLFLLFAIPFKLPFCSLLMILPAILFSCCWLFWIIARNVFFAFHWPVSDMYLSQSPGTSLPRRDWVKATLVDMMSFNTRWQLSFSSSNHDTQGLPLFPQFTKLIGQPQGRDWMCWHGICRHPFLLRGYHL
jgi:hypothetical protein